MKCHAFKTNREARVPNGASGIANVSDASRDIIVLDCLVHRRRRGTRSVISVAILDKELLVYPERISRES